MISVAESVQNNVINKCTFCETLSNVMLKTLLFKVFVKASVGIIIRNQGLQQTHYYQIIETCKNWNIYKDKSDLIIFKLPDT